MEEAKVDYALVPLGLLLFAGYHVWLLFTILKHPRKTVVGLNAESRHQWVLCMMSGEIGTRAEVIGRGVPFQEEH